MAAFKGDKVKIKKSGVVICSGINQKDIKINAENIDDTANSNRGFSVFLSATDTRSITLDFKGIAKDRTLRKLRLNGNNLLQDITYEFANGDTITGNFMMLDYSEAGGFKDAVQFSCSLQSNGPYAFTFSSSEGDDGGAGEGGAAVPLNGELIVIGRWASLTDDYFNLQVSGGYLRGLAITYSLDLGEIEHVYQRRRMLNDGVELQKMAVCAIDGEYAICCELDGLFPTRFVGISPYLIDVQIQTTGAWSAVSMEAGSDFTLIDCGDGFSVVDVVMVAKGNFIIVTRVDDSSVTQWDIVCVDYFSPVSLNQKIITIDLISLGLAGYVFLQQPMRVALSYDNYSVACIVVYADSESESGTARIETVINPLTGELLSQNVLIVDFLDIPSKDSALSGFESFSDQYFSYIFSDYYYGYAEASAFGYRLDGTWTDYGNVIKYIDYESRVLVDERQELFSGAEETVIEMPPLVIAKLLECGYTAVGEPKFGRISAFLK